MHGADRDGEREARLEAAETVEDLISDESEKEGDVEENESSRRRRRLSKAELPVEKTTRRLGIMTDLELEKVKEEEKEALVRLSRRSVPNHRRPSPMSVLVALRRPPRLNYVLSAKAVRQHEELGVGIRPLSQSRRQNWRRRRRRGAGAHAQPAV